MIGGKRVLAVIPARAGSRRLPGKNTRLLGGKPLIQWTIEAAFACGLIDSIGVTTDDPAVVAIAEPLHVDIINRPPEMATDDAPTAPALCHALIRMEWMHGQQFDFVVLLQPTSPFRRPEHITLALAILNQEAVDSVVTVGPDQRPNGAVYASKRAVVMGGAVLGQVRDKLTMTAEESVDIDTAEDFAIAEALIRMEVR